jgi:Mg-dependent DNase
MFLIDTHTHLYLDRFKDDRDSVIQRAINQGVTKMLLPSIDSSTFEEMMNLTKSYPNNCLPMIGLHPTSVKDNYEDELAFVEKELEKDKYIGIGEIGIDLYWDDAHSDQQKDAFSGIL